MSDNQTFNRRTSCAGHLLRYLSDRGIEAVIAGGFMRDALFERPFRDIDLYISERDYDKAQTVLFGGRAEEDPEFFTNGHPEYEHQSISRHEERYVLPNLTHLWPALNLETAQIDLIGLRWDSTVKADVDGREIISRFNIGINQIAMQLVNGKPLEVVWTLAFVADRVDKRITILRNTWGQDATARGVRKVEAKYPGWTPRMADGSAYNEQEFLNACTSYST